MDKYATAIGFENYRINCLIGIEPHERINNQEILIDLKVKIDCTHAIKSENIHDTLDYRLLARLCKQMAQDGQYQLIETYAFEVLEKLMQEFKLLSAWIRVKKPMAIPEADFTYVEMQREAE